jgi:hypothetical protein
LFSFPKNVIFFYPKNKDPKTLNCSEITGESGSGGVPSKRTAKERAGGPAGRLYPEMVL